MNKVPSNKPAVSPSRRSAAIVVVTMCLFILAYFWIFRVRRIDINMEIVCSAVEFKIGTPWNWNPSYNVDTAGVWVGQIGRLESPLLPLLDDSTDGTINLELCGYSTRLEYLLLPEGARLEFTAPIESNRYNPLNIRTGDRRVQGTLSIQGKGKITATDDSEIIERTQLLSMPEPIDFWSGISGQMPMTIDFATPKTTLNINDIKISDLNLTRYGHPDPENRPFISSIRRGNIVIPAADQNITLFEGEELTLKSPVGIITSFHADSTIRFAFMGTVSDIRRGSDGHAYSLKPYLIEYYYKNSRISLMIALFPMLGGVIWKIWKRIRGN